MTLPEPLIPGKLIQRYKRFFADIQLDGGGIVTAHCPNPGSMIGLIERGNEVLVSSNNNPKRKLRYTWELVKVRKKWICVNTFITNRIVHEALLQRKIPEIEGYAEVKTEPAWGQSTRFDFLLNGPKEQCLIEVKNVTLAEQGVAMFPDSVTKRGTKHLNELVAVVNKGYRAIMLFLVNRQDCCTFEPATHIDLIYAKTLREAHKRGVEILVYQTRIQPPRIEVHVPIPFKC